MKIEAGKYYKMRCGAVIGPMDYMSYPRSESCIFECDGERWYGSGKFYGDETISLFDLIEEVPDPTQARLVEFTLKLSDEDRAKLQELSLPDLLTSRTQEVKPTFDRAAFRRETAARFMIEVMRHPAWDMDRDSAAMEAVAAADALLKELGE